jgi:histidinol dehydrogenase
MAYGTATVPRCDKIVGPGNAYVAEAKLQVAAEGACGIDALAGVTEVAIIADDTADPRTSPPTSSPRPSTTRWRPRC